MAETDLTAFHRPRAAKPATVGLISSSWPEGYGRRVLETCDSTNAEALRMVSQTPGPVWIMARQQDAGRGRRGRAWVMPVGNFAATLLLPNPGSAADAARMSFLACLAVDEALRTCCGQSIRSSIKWPNDNLLSGAKVAGILLESVGRSGGQVDAVAIGIGVNLVSSPDLAQLETGALPATNVMAETGLEISADTFLDVMASSCAKWLEQFRAFGFAPVRTAWLARAARLGETIVARTPREDFKGRFEGIDETGALVLITAAGKQTISAADVHFGDS